MNQFVQEVLNAVTGKGALDFNSVLVLLLVYLGLLWVAFCAWVFFDARRRYQRWYVALFIMLVVLILNFPALILYLIVRPEDEISGSSYSGVEVPIANFVDADGSVKLALNLQITKPHSNSDMNISVGWDEQNENIQIGRSRSEQTEDKVKKVATFSELRTKISGRLARKGKKGADSAERSAD